jgi:hypothetical protein
MFNVFKHRRCFISYLPLVVLKSLLCLGSIPSSVGVVVGLLVTIQEDQSSPTAASIFSAAGGKEDLEVRPRNLIPDSCGDVLWSDVSQTALSPKPAASCQFNLVPSIDRGRPPRLVVCVPGKDLVVLGQVRPKEIPKPFPRRYLPFWNVLPRWHCLLPIGGSCPACISSACSTPPSTANPRCGCTCSAACSLRLVLGRRRGLEVQESLLGRSAALETSRHAEFRLDPNAQVREDSPLNVFDQPGFKVRLRVDQWVWRGLKLLELLAEQVEHPVQEK